MNDQIKHYLKYSLFVLILALLETNFFPFLTNFPAPLLVFLFGLVLLSFNYVEEAFFSAFLGGLLLDFLSSGLLGKTALIFLLFLLFVYYVKRYLFDSLLLYLLGLILFSVGWTFLLFSLNMLNSESFSVDFSFVFVNFLSYVFLRFLFGSSNFLFKFKQRGVGRSNTYR